MCGFLMIRDKNLHLNNAKKALKTLKHRGPDHTGTVVSEDIFLGHNRLSIIDLGKNANQPMVNKNGKVILVYNGEIYNYKSLKINFLKDTWFNTNSDSELIIEGYEKFGISFFEKLRGMYAFVMYDFRDNQKKIISVRDSFGIKPLYIFQNEDIYIISSEIKGIISYLNGGQETDQIMILHYLMQGYCSEPRTIYKTIRTQRPGFIEIFNVNNNQHSVKNLNVIQWGSKEKNRYPKNFEFYIRQAVDRNLVSDVPIKVALSSGIDSSTIFALAKHNKKNYGLTVKMENPNFDESKIALQYSKILNKKTEIITINQNINLEKINDLLRHFDQPFGDSSFIPSFFLNKACKKISSTVILGGDGGDEHLYGYDSMHYLYFLNSNLIFKKIINKISYIILKFIQNRKLLKINGLSGNLNESFYYRNSWLLNNALSKNLNSNWLSKSISYKWNTEMEKTSSIDNMIINQFFRTVLLSDYLRKTDMMSMYNGVEYRVPFLDEDLVNYSLTIPKKKKYKFGSGKIPLRTLHNRLYRGFGSYLPKRGFSIPFDEYLKLSEKKEMNYEIKTFMKNGGGDYLDKDYVDGLCNNFMNFGNRRSNLKRQSILQRYFIIYSAAKFLNH